MTDEQIKEKRKELLSDTIIEIISEQSAKPKNIITTNTDIVNDLNCDSLDAVEILMSLEEEFGKVIPEDDAENIGGKVSAIIDYIDKKLTDDEVISWYKRIQGHKLFKEEEKQNG